MAEGAMLEKSPVNSTPARLLAVLAAIAMGGVGTSFLPVTLVAVAHICAAGTWLGVNAWTTFIAGLVMFKNLPRQQFGRLQAKLFPLYFSLCALCSAVLLGTLPHLGATAPSRVTNTLILGLVTALANLVIIEPKTTANMFERYELDGSGKAAPERRKELYKKFGILHGTSSLANLGNLVAVVAHCTWLAALLQKAMLA